MLPDSVWLLADYEGCLRHARNTYHVLLVQDFPRVSDLNLTFVGLNQVQDRFNPGPNQVRGGVRGGFEGVGAGVALWLPKSGAQVWGAASEEVTAPWRGWRRGAFSGPCAVSSPGKC